MIKIGICDDERGIRAYMKDVLSDFFMRTGLLFEVKTYASGDELLESGDQLDILFLDVSMPGTDGIEVGKRLKEGGDSVKIIYITAHSHFAAEAFELWAFNYIVKPIKQDKLYEVLENALLKMDIENHRAVLKIKGFVIQSNEISYIEAQDHQIAICTMDGERNEKNIVKGSLREFEDRLNEFQFEKVRRGLWVNPIHIEDMDEDKIFMTNGDIVQIKL